MTRPLLSLIIPSYGRSQHMGPLLDSLLAQDCDDWECVISEDGSPNQDQIRAVVAKYSARANGRVRFYANDVTMGYDANFRHLVELARGQFLFVMGDDDVIAPGAFNAVARTVHKYPNLGFILRAFAWFKGTPDQVEHVTRYYRDERFFPAGRQAIVACYRRSVSMSGLVLHRDSAQALATDRWDGLVFYQHWLLANILTTRDAVYIPDLLAFTRRGAPPIFGVAEKERALYVPGIKPPSTDVIWIQSMLTIARTVEQERGVKIASLIERDLANYIYQALASHSRIPRREFHEYYIALGKLGLGRYASFHAWYWAIRIFGADNLDRTFRVVRRIVGHTPNLTGFVRSAGRSVSHPTA